jgi:hypothetical protein
MALKGIAETNKSPLKSTRKGAVCIPFRFLTGSLQVTGVVIPGTATVSRTNSTTYVITVPGLRIAPSSTGTGSVLNWLATCQAELATAQYVSAVAFATVATNNTTTITLTLSAAPTDGTQVRGVIWGVAEAVQ